MGEPAAGPMVGAALAGVLRDRRSHFNAIAAEARLLGGGFAAEPFIDALTGPVDALVGAVATVHPAALADVVEVAYRSALSLTARRRHLVGGDGGREDALAQVWAALAHAPSLVAEDPQRLIGSLTNATLAIEATPGAAVTAWTDRIGRLMTAATSGPQLLDGGRVTAWACGMAHHRQAALAVLPGLPPPLAAIALGCPVEVLDDWHPQQRWRAPDGRAPTSRDVGGFLGFGGPFTVPPTVWVDRGGLIHATARPGDGVWRVHGDAFGATLTRAPTDVTQAKLRRRPLIPPETRRVTSVATGEDTLAWTVASSYRIRVAAPGGSGRSPAT